jgi:hypothetical protein
MKFLRRLACSLGWHRFASYEWGELGNGPCLRCGKKDTP